MQPVPPNSLALALEHVAKGGRLQVATRLRVYVVDSKVVAKFAKANAWLLKEEGNGYRLRTGKGSVYLFPGQLVMS